MPTAAASGQSAAQSTDTAISEALSSASASLSSKPTIGFVFASPVHDLSGVLNAARAAHPDADFIGCTTAGEITETGLIHNGIAVMLVHLDKADHVPVYAADIKAGHEQAARTLSEPFATAKRQAFRRGNSASSTVILIDGLSGVGEALVSAVRTNTSAVQQIVGGASGDDGKFEGTQVGLNHQVGGSAAAFHIFGPSMWGVGVNHGLTAATEQMKVTRAEGSVVYEIEGKPAYDIYKDFAASRGDDLTPDNAGPYMIQHEIGIHFLDTVKKARAPLGVDPKGAITCAARVPEGSFISILDGKPDSLVEAAKKAAEEARSNLGGRGAAGVLLFDCICRGLILGDAFDQEIQAVRSVFPHVPVAGFLTYGEIARFKGAFDGWHNTTAVVVAIPA